MDQCFYDYFFIFFKLFEISVKIKKRKTCEKGVQTDEIQQKYEKWPYRTAPSPARNTPPAAKKKNFFTYVRPVRMLRPAALRTYVRTYTKNTVYTPDIPKNTYGLVRKCIRYVAEGAARTYVCTYTKTPYMAKI